MFIKYFSTWIIDYFQAPTTTSVDEEEVQVKVHTRTERENVAVCWESWVEDSEARGICGAATMSRNWSEKKSPQSLDAQ